MEATPVVPPPPALFSITNCWRRRAESRSAKMRANTSVLPPAANGTTTTTALVGHPSWASVAVPIDATAARVTAKAGHFISTSSPVAFLPPMSVTLLDIAGIGTAAILFGLASSHNARAFQQLSRIWCHSHIVLAPPIGGWGAPAIASSIQNNSGPLIGLAG